MAALGAGVAGLVGVLVFGASLDRLVAEPPRQGWNWDYEIGLGDELTDDEALEQVAGLRDDPRIEGAAYARIATKEMLGRSVVTFGLEPLRGDVHLTIVSGRPVRTDDEVVLGRSTLDDLDVALGDTITVDSTDGPKDLRVVGQALFPTNENDDPAAGAAVTLATIGGLHGSDGFPDVFFTAAPGVDVAALRAEVEGELGAVTGSVPPPVVSNLELVDQAPYLLAGYLAALGLAAATHAIVMVVRQRRTELATLRTLGFDRRQVATSVLSHSVTIAVIGVVVGLPIGAAVGRVTWRLVAGGLGFATDPRSPLAVVAAPPGAIVLAALVALGPALWASRQRPATILRTE
jgi:ABC-type lipoprotein release transport system permease subunit